MTDEQRVHVVELVKDWQIEDRLSAVIGILDTLTPDAVISFWEREALIAMAKGPCDAMLLNLVEKDGRFGLVGVAASMYIIDFLRQWITDARANRMGAADREPGEQP